MSNKLEKQVRDPCIKFAKSTGLALHKRMHFGHGTAGGWPDDLFLFDDGRHWWVEFKATGKSPSPLQEETHRQMRERGCIVDVIDNNARFNERLQLLAGL